MDSSNLSDAMSPIKTFLTDVAALAIAFALAFGVAVIVSTLTHLP